MFKPKKGTPVKVFRGSSVYLGVVQSDEAFTVGGKLGFGVHVHNENGRPASSSLFVSDETYVIIPA